ncbi:hypothetical protein UT300013_33480 [Paraclostridium sordellii]
MDENIVSEIWQFISNFSSLITIATSVLSIFFWFRTKRYYNKVKNLVQLETFASLESYLNEIRTIYNAIERMNNAYIKRGNNNQKSIDMHLDISENLNYIRKKIPSEFKTILKTIECACSEINTIKDNESYTEKNVNFKELGVHIINLEEGFKVEKEKLKGI